MSAHAQKKGFSFHAGVVFLYIKLEAVFMLFSIFEITFPNPAEVFFLFQGLFKTSFLPGAILSVPHLLTRQWNSSPYFLELCLSVVFYDTHLHIWFIPLQTSSRLYSSTAPHRMNWNQCPTRDSWNELSVLRASFCCSFVNT